MRDAMLILNTSSADRSLSALIDIFAKVKKAVPKARLAWCYGWQTFDSVHGTDSEKTAWKKKLIQRMQALGVEDMGRLSHGAVQEMYKRANVFLYPTGFFEIDCISARKAQLFGAIPVTTDFAALATTVKFGTKFHTNLTERTWSQTGEFDFAIKDEEMKDAMAEEVQRLLLNPPTEDEREMMMRATRDYSWDNIARRWAKNFL